MLPELYRNVYQLVLLFWRTLYFTVALRIDSNAISLNNIYY